MRILSGITPRTHAVRTTLLAAAVATVLALSACGERAPANDPAAATAAPTAAPAETTPPVESVDRPVAAVLVSVPDRTAMPAEFAAQVGTWRTADADALWVDSVAQEKPSGFGSLFTLSFGDRAAADAWRGAHAADVAAPATLVAADVLASGAHAGAAPAAPVYKISYYALTAPRADFQAWVDGYLVKYLDAQLAEGILTRYDLYLETEAAGRALLVLEYPDAATEQGAEPIKGKLSDALAAEDPVYAEQMERKEGLRTTQSWTLAVPAAKR